MPLSVFRVRCAYAVKHIPSWFPGAQFKRDAEVWKSKMEAFVNEPYDFTKQQMVRRQASCFPLRQLWV